MQTMIGKAGKHEELAMLKHFHATLNKAQRPIIILNVCCCAIQSVCFVRCLIRKGNVFFFSLHYGQKTTDFRARAS